MCYCNETNTKVLNVSPKENIKPSSQPLHASALALLQELSPQQIEAAACMDYQYLSKATNDREASALAMVERYLNSKSTYQKALTSLQATLDFRADRAIDSKLRRIPERNSQLWKNLSNGNAFVSGRDRTGRSTLIFVPRLVQDHEGSIDGLLYTLERAIACTNGTAEINAIVDFAGFEVMKHTPPLSVGKRILTLLRNHYVGHVNRICFVHSPKSVHYVWNTFKVFAGQKTREKIAFVDDLQDLYENDQLPPSIMKTGTCKEFDAETYFSVAYDGL